MGASSPPERVRAGFTAGAGWRARTLTVRFDGCPGNHVAAAVPTPEHLRWYRVDRPDRVRVIESTCWRCGDAGYELCSSGGRYLIRRSMGAKVYDSPRVRRVLAEQWWAGLLAGRVV